VQGRFVATIALVVVACSPKQSEPTTAPGLGEPSAAPEAAPPAVESPVENGGATETPAANPPEPITYSAEGIGPMRSDSVVTEEGLAAMFPGSTVERSVRSAEGEDYPIFVVVIDGHKVLTVMPDRAERIHDVEIRSTAWDGPAGVRVGMTFDEVAKRLGGLRCFNGVEDLYDLALCMPNDQAMGGSYVQYVFALEGNKEIGQCERGGCKVPNDRALQYARWVPERPD